MIDHGLDDVREHADPSGHMRYDRPADIVWRPLLGDSGTDPRLEPVLGCPPTLPARIIAAEYEGAISVALLQDRLCGVAERHDMCAVILGPLTGQDDHLVVDFFPPQRGNLVCPLSGESQQPDDVAIIVVPAGVPYRLEFGQAQHAFARLLVALVRVTDNVAFGESDALFQHPGEECV